MNEQKPEKKLVGRTVAIALGIICIVLAIGLVGAISEYTSIMNEKNSTILSQRSQISSLQNEVNNLTEQVDNLTDIVEFHRFALWLYQPFTVSANSNTSWVFSASYAGYVYVYVQSRNIVGTYFRVTYHSFHGFNGDYYQYQLDNVTYIGADAATFPILPSSNIRILVGTTNPNGMTGNVTIEYFY